jgi:hypothetical protein
MEVQDRNQSAWVNSCLRTLEQVEKESVYVHKPSLAVDKDDGSTIIWRKTIARHNVTAIVHTCIGF